MRIAIDASSAAASQKTGVAKYISRLIEHLEKLGDDNEYSIYYRVSRWKKRAYFYRPIKETTRVRLFQEPLISGKKIDVFHGPDARIPRLRGPKLVATVNDLFSLVTDEFADARFRRKKIARYTDIAQRADRIICISESTRRDFIRFFPASEAKTLVIPQGVDEEFYPRPQSEVDRIKTRYGIASDYILYVGSISKRKNLIRMCDAFRRVSENGRQDLSFAIAGKATYGREEIMKHVSASGCAGRIRLIGYVPDEDLPALYSGARLLLFATLYEGFGVPIIEALACGAPVVTSNVSSMNEIMPEMTCRVDPNSVAEIAEGVVATLKRGDEAKNGLGRECVVRAGYTWQAVAGKTLATYSGGDAFDHSR
jgi:alpha-1,3-rhamnosyl/mannosyltransferase